MASQELASLLAAVYSPATPPEQKRAAEAALQQLAATPQALEWALGALSNAAAPGADLQALFFACSVADETVAFRWPRLEAGRQAALRSTLWRAATEPGGPHFVRQKAAAALTHVACLDWPERFPSFWPDLQTCLADPARRASGVDLLAATLDHFHSLAQTTSAGLKGRVLSAAVPDIQRRYSELQPVALATLHSLLQLLASSLPAAAAAAGGNDGTLALAVRTLRALRAALADANRLPEQHGISSAALVALLFEFVGAARLAPADRDDEAGEHLAQVAAAALDCAADLQAKHYGTEATQQMLEALLPKLQETCGLVQERWARQGGAFQLDDPLVASFVRLLVQFFTMQLSNVDATPQLGAALQGLLAQVLALTHARGSPIDVLLFLEVWHAVLSYLDSFEDALWEAGDDVAAQQQIKKAVAGYKEPILAVSDLLLSALCPAGGAAAPFSLDALSSAPSSGTAMEDWLQSVVSGGDSGREDEAAAARDEAAGAEEDEYEEALLVPGAAQGFQGDSEYDVWVRHAEGFLGRAIGSFSSDLLPAVLLRFQGAGAAFEQACQAAAAGVAQAVAAGRSAASPAAALHGWLPAFRAMDICLRLLTRCGPSFPTRGAAASSAGLAPAAGSGEPVSGAHAAQCLRATFQLAGGWLQAVQSIAAASQHQGQHQGQPATPSLAAAAAGGSGEGGGLSTMLLAGSRLYKAAGSLTATWLSQLLAGLVQGSADPDAGPVAQQLVQGLLSTAATLLQAVASPHLAGWQPLLHRGAVWAAESLVSLSSIALSSALKPPTQLLEGVWRSQEVQAQLRPVAQASLANPALLPVRACRALWLALSDLCLRCWSAQPAAQFDAAARGAAFADLVGALALTLHQAAAAGQAAGGREATAAAAAARHAAAVAAAIVQSYAGSPKAVRGIVSGALVGPALPSVLAILHARPGGSGSGAAGPGLLRGKASAALLRLVAASLEVLATELGSEAVEQLLGALVQIFGAAGGDPSFESDLLMLQLVVSLLSQGGAHKHAQLLLPAVLYCLAVWERASAPGASGATDADVQHVRAVALSALLSLLRYRWKALMGGRSGGGSAAPAGSLAQQAAAAAAGGQAGEGGSEGAAIVMRVLQLLLEFFGAAASLAVVLPAADVRLVLEELFELQLATRLYSLPLFQAARGPLAACLLGMLLSRLYRTAQDELGDTLFALAAANWSEWHLSILPGVVDSRLGGAGPSERAALLALWGGADLDAHSFERHLHAFLNDAAHYERSCGGAGKAA